MKGCKFVELEVVLTVGGASDPPKSGAIPAGVMVEFRGPGGVPEPEPPAPTPDVKGGEAGVDMGVVVAGADDVCGEEEDGADGGDSIEGVDGEAEVDDDG